MSLICEFDRTSDTSFQEVAVVTSDLFNDVVATCQRAAAMKHTQQAVTFADLVSAGAWTDASLALIAMELPQWSLRRLAYDNGEWHCALSDNREMPDWLDASIETHHANMPLAILSAFLEARRTLRTSHVLRASMRSVDDALYEPLGSDNFS